MTRQAEYIGSRQEAQFLREAERLIMEVKHDEKWHQNRHGEEAPAWQLKKRLGAVSATHEKSIRKLGLSKIERLCEALLDFNTRSPT